MMNQTDLPIIVIPDQNHLQLSPPGSRRMTGDNTSLQDALALTSRRPSAITALRRPSSNALIAQRRLMLEYVYSH